MTTEIENAYTTIARHITSPVGQCVLILGPEFVKVSGKQVSNKDMDEIQALLEQ